MASGEERFRAALRRVRVRIPTRTPHLQLLRLITQNLTQSELANIAFEMGIDADALAGDAHADKARSLILAARRHGGESWLLQTIRRHRPDLSRRLDELAPAFE